MNTSIEIPLCDYEDELGRHELYAVLDEHSLTYRVLLREPDGHVHAVRQLVPSRLKARQWAEHYRYKQSPAVAKAGASLTHSA